MTTFRPNNLFLLLFAIFFILPHLLMAQKNTYTGIPSPIWPILYDITYETTKDESGEFEKPIFSKSAKTLEGKEVTIPGYIIPFQSTSKSDSFMFSSLPLNACFFCGVGGPETVVQVKAYQMVDYIDKPVEIRGKLVLNTDNPDEHFYILESAEYLGVVDW